MPHRADVSRMKRPGVIVALLFLLIGGAAVAAGSVFGFSGQKSLTLKDHLPRPLGGLTSSEQWSASVRFADGSTLNANLVHSNLTTKGDKASFRVEYFPKGGKRISEQIRCPKPLFTDNPVSISCGGAALLGNTDDIKVQFPGKKLSVVMKMKSVGPSFRPGDGRLPAQDDAKEYYDVVLTMPRAVVTAKIGEEVMQGVGFMDHSYTSVAWHRISRHWLRMSHITPEYTMILAVWRRQNGDTAGFISYVDDKGGRAQSGAVDISLTDLWQDPDKDGYQAPRRVQVTAKDGSFSFDAGPLVMKSRRDMLDDLSKVEAFVVRRFSDPMVYTMMGPATFRHKGGVREESIRIMVKQLNP